ncbi:MAG: hypothetical protein WAM97_05540 [Acidimicrobiales bacterium]|jgi:hypothetical protein
MKMRLLGAGFAMTLSVGAAVLATPAASYATTCYTGCHTTTPTSPGGKPASDGDGGDGGTAATPTSASSLAFTGANVVLPTSLGTGAVVIGGALVFAGRRRRIRSAA